MSSNDNDAENDCFDAETDGLHSTAFSDENEIEQSISDLTNETDNNKTPCTDINYDYEEPNLNPKRLEFNSDYSEDDDKENTKLPENEEGTLLLSDQSTHSLNRSTDDKRQVLTDIHFDAIGDTEIEVSCDESSPEKLNSRKVEIKNMLIDISDSEMDELNKCSKRYDRLQSSSPISSSFESSEIDRVEKLRNHLKTMMIMSEPSTSNRDRDIYNRNASCSLEENVIKMVSEISSQRHVAPSNILQDDYEKEKFRRKRCEAEIQDLHSKLLESQQQISILTSTEKKKDGMIEQLDSTLGVVVQSWRKKELERKNQIDQLILERNDLKNKVDKLSHVVNNNKIELTNNSRKISEYQEQLTRKEKKYFSEINKLTNENTNLKNKILSLDIEIVNMTKLIDKSNKDKSNMVKDFNQERESFEEKEAEYIQKIEEINEKQLNSIQKAQDEKNKLEKSLTELQQSLNQSQKEFFEKINLYDSLDREKEQLAIQIQIIQTRCETEKRALKAELEAESERKLIESLEDCRRQYQEENQQLRERHQFSIDDVKKRLENEINQMSHKHEEELHLKDEKYRESKQFSDNRLNEGEIVIDKLQIENSALNRRIQEMARRLRLITQSNYDEIIKILDYSSQINTNMNNQNNNQEICSARDVHSSTEISVSDDKIENVIETKNSDSQISVFSLNKSYETTEPIQQTKTLSTIDVKNSFSTLELKKFSFDINSDILYQNDKKDNEQQQNEISEKYFQIQLPSLPANSTDFEYSDNENLNASCDKNNGIYRRPIYDKNDIVSNVLQHNNNNEKKQPSISSNSTNSFLTFESRNINKNMPTTEQKNRFEISRSSQLNNLTSSSPTSFEVPAESVDYLFNSSTFKQYRRDHDRSEVSKNVEIYQPRVADCSNYSFSSINNDNTTSHKGPMENRVDTDSDDKSQSESRQQELHQYIGKLLQRPVFSNSNSDDNDEKQKQLKAVVDDYENDSKPNLKNVLSNLEPEHKPVKDIRSKQNSKQEKFKPVQQNVLKPKKPTYNKKSDGQTKKVKPNTKQENTKKSDAWK